ncbi:MAG: nucleotide exchange factor GrpE [Proteobacteria bacterium]|nr:nucleotide exchange factor GrpE [Pseudomonadota bacterium]
MPRRLAEDLLEERDRLARRLQTSSEELDRLRCQLRGRRATEADSKHRSPVLKSRPTEPLGSEVNHELEQCNSRLEQSSEEVQHGQWRDRAHRLAADLANVRAHVDQSIDRGVLQERIERLASLAEIYDSVARSLTVEGETNSPWYEGNSALLAQISAEIRRGGATAVGDMSDPFDPKLHEAIGVVESDYPPDTIVEVVQKGFVLDEGGLVRPARVIVSI